MSERQQHTAAHMREKMLAHYGDLVHHKHNKNHLLNPPHHRSKLANTLVASSEEVLNGWQMSFSRKTKLRKMQRRLAKLNFH